MLINFDDGQKWSKSISTLGGPVTRRLSGGQ